ncbi:hypothetical protein TNCV_4164421 [Trichonephila clavipes]|nr:hypothetical protein TNCV_4164421 [Trichonephila clavipes]
MSSPGFGPSPYGTDVSVANHCYRWYARMQDKPSVDRHKRHYSFQFVEVRKGVAAAQFRPHHLTMVKNARIITKSRGVAEWGGNNIPSRTWQQLNMHSTSEDGVLYIPVHQRRWTLVTTAYKNFSSSFQTGIFHVKNVKSSVVLALINSGHDKTYSLENKKGDPSSQGNGLVAYPEFEPSTTVQMGPLHVKSAEAQMLPLVWRRGSSSGVILFIPSPKALVLLSLIFTRSPGISVSKYITCLPLCEHESILLVISLYMSVSQTVRCLPLRGGENKRFKELLIY